MEVISGVASLVLIAICLCVLGAILRTIGGIAWAIINNLWPTIVGIFVCYFLWNAGHDNYGVLAAIFGVFVNLGLGSMRDRSSDSYDGSSHYHWSDDKKTIYDKNKTITGYQDR
jgi:predicted outer membrane lipoprotein